MLPSFEGVEDRLLRAGIAPRRVRRYVSELREHLDDLVNDERAMGLDTVRARERAVARLGSEAELTESMIQRVPSGTLSARAPWAVFFISPLLLLITALTAIAVSTYRALWPVRSLALEEMPRQYRAVIDLSSFVANDLIGMVVAATCIVIALRQRVTSVWVWIGLAVTAFINSALGVHMHVTAPHGNFKGGVMFSLLNIAYVDGVPNLAASLGTTLVRTAALFALTGGCYYVLRHRLTSVHAQVS